MAPRWHTFLTCFHYSGRDNQTDLPCPAQAPHPASEYSDCCLTTLILGARSGLVCPALPCQALSALLPCFALWCSALPTLPRYSLPCPACPSLLTKAMHASVSSCQVHLRVNQFYPLVVCLFQAAYFKCMLHCWLFAADRHSSPLSQHTTHVPPPIPLSTCLS